MVRGKSRAVKNEPGLAGKKKKRRALKPPVADDHVIDLDYSSDEEAAPPAKVGKRKQQASGLGAWKKTKGADAAPSAAAAPHDFTAIQKAVVHPGFEHIEKGTIHPKFLHTNSTTHKWAFGAIAELIDNAVDQDVAATQLQIELRDVKGKRCLTFFDNGNGLSRDGLAKMLGFGHSHKLETDIGRYGNGFKAGSMRLGDDALVLTKCKSAGTQSVGFLSQSFLRGINAEHVLVPMLSWTLDKDPQMLDPYDKAQENLAVIAKYSVFKSEEELLAQLSIIKFSGCCIVITNLKKDEDGRWELRTQDPVPGLASDIVLDASPEEPTLKRSLRAYLEVLYYQPRMQLFLNRSMVDVERILGCLAGKMTETYTPKGQQGEAQKDKAQKNEKGIAIHVGFNSRYAKRVSENKDSEVGYFLYEKNRLICPFYKVGMHTRQDERGARVIGVVEVDNFLTPMQHKQEFQDTPQLRNLNAKLGKVLDIFWWKHRESVDDGSADARTHTFGPKGGTPDNLFVMCQNPACLKWRLIAVRLGCSKCRWSPGGCTACKKAAVVKQFVTEDMEKPEKFTCYMHPDPNIGGDGGQGCNYPDNVSELEELQKKSMLNIFQDDKKNFKIAMKKRKQDNQLTFHGDAIQESRRAELDRREAELEAREAAVREGRVLDTANNPGTALLSPADQPETPHVVSTSDSESESLDDGGEDEGLNEVFDAETVDNIMECPTCVDPPHQVNLGLAFEGECDRCGTYLHGKPSEEAFELPCRLCGKFRGPFTLGKLRQLETSDMTCPALIGSGCRATKLDVNAGGTAPEGGEIQERVVPVVVDSPERFADAAHGQATRHHASQHEFDKGTRWLEFVPGVDKDWSPEACAAGLHLYHGKGEDHVLWATALPREAFGPLKTYIDALLAEEASGTLPLNTDARVSSGPVDLNQFLKKGSNKALILAAIRRLPALRGLSYQEALKYTVHVHPNQRAVYIGDGEELSKNGKKHIAFNKAWKSDPIRSWSGGRKMADMGGDRGRELVVNQLTKDFPGLEPHIAAAAGHLWKLFERELPDPASRMQNFFAENEGMDQARLGESAWNAYNVNINYRTGQHLDHKNLPGSYSCLVILEAGPTFAGAYYLLPQFRQALNLKQGCIVFHRSGDASCGYHGNSELHQPDKYATKRIAVVFYLSEISQKKEKGKGGGQEAARDKGKAPMAPPPPLSLAPSGPGETAAFFGERGEPSGL